MWINFHGNIFSWLPQTTKIFQHKNYSHENFWTQKFPKLWYSSHTCTHTTYPHYMYVHIWTYGHTDMYSTCTTERTWAVTGRTLSKQGQLVRHFNQGGSTSVTKPALWLTKTDKDPHGWHVSPVVLACCTCMLSYLGNNSSCITL